ncbi:MAG: Omp28 family outer membrane lipoprotein [Bacteroidetes bacterium]|nr:Omp28 family outer membrane lipoprotein [Bacteroidota bacterium]
MKALKLICLPLFALLTFQSCDEVEAPYKEDIIVVGGDRKVLVEDYTGHKCGNCPRAAKALHDLKDVYGDRLIIMTVHAGGFATVFPPSAPYYTYDFRTPEGTELDSDFGISAIGNPNGMVNRRQVNGNYVLSSTSWLGEISNVLGDASPAPVKIEIENTFDVTSRTLQTEINSEFVNSLGGAHKLCVFLVEDSIINWQKDYDASPEDIPDYVHRDVLRTSMNGTYGDAIANTSAGTIDTKNYSKTLDATWNENNMKVISFVYNEVTKEIIQVEEHEVIH